MFVVSAIVFFIVPMLIVTVLYILIAFRLRRSSKLNSVIARQQRTYTAPSTTTKSASSQQLARQAPQQQLPIVWCRCQRPPPAAAAADTSQQRRRLIAISSATSTPAKRQTSAAVAADERRAGNGNAINIGHIGNDGDDKNVCADSSLRAELLGNRPASAMELRRTESSPPPPPPLAKRSNKATRLLGQLLGWLLASSPAKQRKAAAQQAQTCDCSQRRLLPLCYHESLIQHHNQNQNKNINNNSGNGKRRQLEFSASDSLRGGRPTVSCQQLAEREQQQQLEDEEVNRLASAGDHLRAAAANKQQLRGVSLGHQQLFSQRQRVVGGHLRQVAAIAQQNARKSASSKKSVIRMLGKCVCVSTCIHLTIARARAILLFRFNVI